MQTSQDFMKLEGVVMAMISECPFNMRQKLTKKVKIISHGHHLLNKITQPQTGSHTLKMGCIKLDRYICKHFEDIIKYMKGHFNFKVSPTEEFKQFRNAKI